VGRLFPFLGAARRHGFGESWKDLSTLYRRQPKHGIVNTKYLNYIRRVLSNKALNPMRSNVHEPNTPPMAVRRILADRTGGGVSPEGPQ
jgi:hypothetical protein